MQDCYCAPQYGSSRPPLKPYDQRGLLTFADQLRDCQNVLESIGYLNEINSADNLSSVVERFPFHLRIKWLEVADRLQESVLRPKMHLRVCVQESPNRERFCIWKHRCW